MNPGAFICIKFQLHNDNGTCFKTIYISLNSDGQNSTNINKINNLLPQVVEHKIYHDIWQEWLWYSDLCLYVNEEPLRVYRICGYLWKIPVLRLNSPRHSAREFFVSRLVFFTNTPPKHDISVQNTTAYPIHPQGKHDISV
jgi:hypothetical protein